MRVALAIACLVAVFVGVFMWLQPSTKLAAPSAVDSPRVAPLIERAPAPLPSPELVVLQNTPTLVAPAITQQVLFPDGTAMPLELRPFLADVELLEVENYADEFVALEQAALAGDSSAAYALATGLRQCSQDSYSSETEMREALALLESEHALPGSSGGPKVELSAGDAGFVDVEAVKVDLLANYAKCKGLTSHQKERADDFLKLAADQGSYVALGAYARSLPEESPQRAAYLEKAWSQGDFNAALWLADAYDSGISGVAFDPVTAQAYRYLSHEITRLSLTDDQGRTAAFFDKVSPFFELEEKTRQLSFEQSAQAMLKAKDILRNAQRCCVGGVSRAPKG